MYLIKPIQCSVVGLCTAFLILSCSPGSRQEKEQPYSIQMHLHGLSNHNATGKPASIQWHTQYAKKYGTDVLWWTDHVGVFERTDTLVIHPADGELDEKNLSVIHDTHARFPGDPKADKEMGHIKGNVIGGRGTVRVADGYLYAHLKNDPELADTSRFSFSPGSALGLVRGLKWARPIVGGVVVEAEIDLEKVDPSASAFFRFHLSWHNYGEPIPYEIVYRLIPGQDAAKTELIGDSTVQVTLPYPEGKSHIAFDLQDAARMLRDGEDCTLRKIEWGVETTGYASTFLGVRELLLRSTEHDRETYWNNIRLIMDRYEDEYGIRQEIGGEFA